MSTITSPRSPRPSTTASPQTTPDSSRRQSTDTLGTGVGHVSSPETLYRNLYAPYRIIRSSNNSVTTLYHSRNHRPTLSKSKRKIVEPP